MIKGNNSFSLIRLCTCALFEADQATAPGAAKPSSAVAGALRQALSLQQTSSGSRGVSQEEKGEVECGAQGAPCFSSRSCFGLHSSCHATSTLFLLSFLPCCLVHSTHVFDTILTPASISRATSFRLPRAFHLCAVSARYRNMCGAH